MLTATTSDGVNAPVSTPYAQPIAIDSGGLAAPTNLVAARSLDAATLTWTPSTSASAIGTTVHHTNDVGAQGYMWSAVAAGLMTACEPGRFCPDTAVTRESAAIVLLRAKHGGSYRPPACTGMFADEPCTRAGAPYAGELARQCITSGCGGTPPTFCPTTAVTRAQLALFLCRMFILPQACDVPVC